MKRLRVVFAPDSSALGRSKDVTLIIKGHIFCVRFDAWCTSSWSVLTCRMCRCHVSLCAITGLRRCLGPGGRIVVLGVHHIQRPSFSPAVPGTEAMHVRLELQREVLEVLEMHEGFAPQRGFHRDFQLLDEIHKDAPEPLEFEASPAPVAGWSSSCRESQRTVFASGSPAQHRRFSTSLEAVERVVPPLCVSETLRRALVHPQWRVSRGSVEAFLGHRCAWDKLPVLTCFKWAFSSADSRV